MGYIHINEVFRSMPDPYQPTVIVLDLDLSIFATGLCVYMAFQCLTGRWRSDPDIERLWMRLSDSKNNSVELTYAVGYYIVFWFTGLVTLGLYQSYWSQFAFSQFTILHGSLSVTGHHRLAWAWIHTERSQPWKPTRTIQSLEEHEWSLNHAGLRASFIISVRK